MLLDLPDDSPLTGLAADQGNEVILVLANRQDAPAPLAVSWPEHSLAAPRVRFIASDTPLAALPGEYRTGELEATVQHGAIQVVAPPFSVLQIKAQL